MSQDGGAQLLGPAAALQLAHSHERMLLAGGVALIVVIVQQGGGGVELDHRRPLVGRQAQPVRFRLTVGGHARLHGQGVFAQTLALSPFP